MCHQFVWRTACVVSRTGIGGRAVHRIVCVNNIDGFGFQDRDFTIQDLSSLSHPFTMQIQLLKRVRQHESWVLACAGVTWTRHYHTRWLGHRLSQVEEKRREERVTRGSCRQVWAPISAFHALRAGKGYKRCRKSGWAFCALFSKGEWKCFTGIWYWWADMTSHFAREMLKGYLSSSDRNSWQRFCIAAWTQYTWPLNSLV